MRRRSLCSALVLAIGFVAVAAAQAPPQQAGDTAYDNSTGQSANTTTASDDSAYSTGWGVIWYVRGVNAQDPGTWVEGGAHGSALLLEKDPFKGETKWILLHGRSLFLGPYGGPFQTVLAQPGEYVLSRRFMSYDTNASPADARRLSDYLLQLYQRARIIHAPFLVGQSWDATAAGNAGASFEEAEALLAAMNLRLVVADNKRVGAAIWQYPVGGTPMRAGDAVVVQFDGAVNWGRPETTAVDEPSVDDAAIELCPKHKVLETTARIKATHRSHPTARACRNGRDVFWLLPSTMTGMKLTIKHGSAPFNDFTLSAWIFNADGTLYGAVKDSKGQPVCNSSASTIEFVVPPGRVYVAADLPPNQLSGDASVRFESDCACPTTQATQPTKSASRDKP